MIATSTPELNRIREEAQAREAKKAKPGAKKSLFPKSVPTTSTDGTDSKQKVILFNWGVN